MVARKSRIIIVGARMAGLTAANRLHVIAGDVIDVTVLEAGDRIGGRILTSDFTDDRIKMGATWIHDIVGSPVHVLVDKIGTLTANDSYEWMDGFPKDPVTVSEGSMFLTPSFVKLISSLYKYLMDSARDGRVAAAFGGVGAYLRSGMNEHCGKLTANGGDGRAIDVVFAMNENTKRTFTSADDLDDLNLAAESEYREFLGDQIMIAKGYSWIIKTLAAPLPKDLIWLNSKVWRIKWSNDNDHVRVHVEGEIVTADHVIVTVSLGVLKAGLKKEADPGFALEFSPGLPAFKKEAIGRLGYGVVDKLFIEIGSEEDSSFPFLQLAFDAMGEGPVVEIPWWMRKTASIYPIYGGSHVLLAWLAGEEAIQMEELEDEEVVGAVHAMLDGFSPSGKASKYDRVLRVKRSG